VAVLLFSLVFMFSVFAQEDESTFRVEVRSAFVWGEDVPGGAVSWSVQDPLTGSSIRKLKHAGVELSSRMGFEKLPSEQLHELIAYTTTVANNTDTPLSVEYAGTTIDGHSVPPLSIIPASKSRHHKRFKANGNAVGLEELYCFRSGFLSEDHFLMQSERSSTLVVDPRSSLTVSSVSRDPRYYPILCSTDGCLPKGTIRYAIRVGCHDYVFTWSSRMVVNCGK